MVVLKELICNSLYFGRVCSGPERTDFDQLKHLGECTGSFERTDL